MLHKLPGTLQENHWFGSAILPYSRSRPPPTPFLSPFLSPNQFKLQSFSLNFHNRNAQAMCYTGGERLAFSASPQKKKKSWKKKNKKKNSSRVPYSSLLTGSGAGTVGGQEPSAVPRLPPSAGGGCAEFGALPGGPGAAAPLLAPLLSPLLSRRLRLPPPRTHRLAARGRRMSRLPRLPGEGRLRGVD